MLTASRTLVISFLVVLAACSTNEPSPSASAAGPSATVDAGAVTLDDIPRLVAAVQPSVASILRPDGGEGSAVIWSSDGIVVTNDHVVADASSVVVAFADGQRVDGEVLATDPRTDLAVVRADRGDLPAATFSQSLPEVGELALALGNPIGFENSATQGIVSGLHRSIPGSAQVSAALVDLIQTDAAISPGNSGGALVNRLGEVMGINVAYIPPNSQAGAVSIGFAIPAPTAADVVEELLEDGTVEHAYLGIQADTLTPQLAAQLNVQAESGAIILLVQADGPAEEAGLEAGDIIVAIDERRVESLEDLLAALRDYEPGDEVVVTFVRGDEEQEVEATLGELPLPG